jgi:hypothetical protein
MLAHGFTVEQIVKLVRGRILLLREQAKHE